jgi:hypothetical protein
MEAYQSANPEAARQSGNTVSRLGRAAGSASSVYRALQRCDVAHANTDRRAGRATNQRALPTPAQAPMPAPATGPWPSSPCVRHSSTLGDTLADTLTPVYRHIRPP